MSILSDSVLAKYHTAASICNEAAKRVLMAANPGALVLDLCRLGDDFILEQTAKVFTGCHNGIAFATCVCPNEFAFNLSPESRDESPVLKYGDLISVELGVFVDGYIATVAHTSIVGNLDVAVEGRKADVVCAAYFATECALRMVRQGAQGRDIIDLVNKIARGFGVKPVVGISSRLMKQFLLEGEEEIPNGVEGDEAETHVFGANEVYAINIAMSTGAGAVKALDCRPSILQRDVQASYNFRLKASRSAFNDISKTFSVFPFASRALIDMNPTHKLGLNECLNHKVVFGRPTMIEAPGEFVAHNKITVLLLPSGTLRLTAPLSPPFVHSEYSILGTFVENLLKQDVRVAKAKFQAL